MDPIVQLTQWRHGLAGRRLAERLSCWGESEPALARFAGSPEQLLRFLRTPPTPERDAVLCALLRQAKHDRLAGLIVLEALLPGLKALAGSILFEARESEELLALLLESAWERIVRYPVARRPGRVAANLLLDIRKQTLKRLAAQRPGSTLPLTGREPAPRESRDVELLLRDAVAAGALRWEDATLILETRIDGKPLQRLVAELGESYITVYKRRERAERRLLRRLEGQPVKKRAPKRHMSSARGNAAGDADSASGGAGR